ncbi:MAG: transglycosylase SLT domain-containing protein [Proteobacteria bacterium]|nr:transglycosylase SLT domain-containing protein [Pseudomonadota bacterium]
MYHGRRIKNLLGVSAAGCLGMLLLSCHPGESPNDAIQTPKLAQIQQSDAQPSDAQQEKTLPLEPLLSVHKAALEAIQPPPPPHLSPVMNDCLGERSPLYKAVMRSIDHKTEGTRLLLAMRLAESDDANIDKSLDIVSQLIAEAKDDRELLDIYSFHAGRFWLHKAEICQNDSAQCGENTSDEVTAALRKAHAYFDAVTQFRRSPYYHEARALYIRTGLKLGQNMSKTLEDFIRTYPDYPGILDFKLALAEADWKNGKQDKALEIVQDLAYLYPWSPISQKAEQWLKDKGQTNRPRSFDEDFARVDALRRARFWDAAESAAQEALPKYPESYQLMVQHARIAYERSHHEEAAHRFEKILEKLNGETKDKLRPAGVIAYIYRAYGYMGDCDTALKYHAQNAAKLGKKDRAQSTMEFALACGALDVAYKNAQIVYSENDSADNLAQFAFIAYLAKDYANARKYWAMAVPDLTGTYKRRANYFLAQATYKAATVPPEQQNQTQTASKSASKSQKGSKTKKVNLPAPTIELARKRFQSILNEDSNDYYAILARTRLNEIDRKDEPSPKTPMIQSFDGKSLEGAFRPWSSAYTFDETKLPSATEQELKKFEPMFPGLRRVLLFHQAELYRERNAEFRTIAIEAMGITKLTKRPVPNNLWTTKLSIDGHLVDNRRNSSGYWGCPLNAYRFELPSKNDTKARQEIAEHQQAIYDHASEVRQFIKDTLFAFHDYYLARKYTASPKSTCGTDENSDACAALYPHAFTKSVISAAQKNNISPDLVWALMNIESAFNPDSVSHADAYGLLQIIPMTGYKIAEALHDTEFGPYDLIRPEHSIEMGTWYFAQILHKFHGDAALSMASYNGGPHQVARWLTAYGGKVERDAFIELIPYNEARNYVKKGMARLLIFHRIDHHDPNFFFELPNTLPQSFEEMPNY